MKFYINGPRDKGEGVYSLLDENGEHFASHFCSHLGYARGDLTIGFSGRREEFIAKYGPLEVDGEPQHEIAWLGDVPQEERDELLRKNHALGEIWDAFHPCTSGCNDSVADGDCPRHGNHPRDPEPCAYCEQMKEWAA